MKNILSLSFLICLSLSSTNSLFAQEDLLQLVDNEKPKKTIVKNAFKSTRVVNGHSMEFLGKGVLDLRILHRFGQVDQGLKQLFGLDQASMRMGLDYGISNNLMVGFGRSTYKKELDGFFKFAPIRQSTGHHSFPVSIILVGGMTVNTLPWEDPTRTNYFSSRLAYYFQGIIGRKFNEVFTLQISPTVVHTNLVTGATDPNDVYSMGVGGRIKLTKRIALTADYFYRINTRGDEGFYDPLSIGIDIETGGHVFQLHLSNTPGMNERAFINETTNSWANGEIRFGFNLSRVFQVVKPKR